MKRESKAKMSRASARAYATFSSQAEAENEARAIRAAGGHARVKPAKKRLGVVRLWGVFIADGEVKDEQA